MTSVTDWFGKGVEATVKVSTLTFVAFTALGSIVVALADARYGFICANPFRLKIVFAGFNFCLFLSLCTFPQSVFYNISRRYINQFRDLSLEREELGTWNLLFNQAIAASLSLSFALNLLAQTTTLRLSAFLATATFLGGAVNLAIAKTPNDAALPGWRRALLYLAFLLQIALLVLPALLGGSSDVKVIQATILFGSLQTTLLLLMLRPPELKKTVRQTDMRVIRESFTPLAITMPLILISLYSRGVYPRLAASWGGGGPLPIRLHLLSGPAYLSLQGEVKLLDETEQGLYIVTAPGEYAHYVPRAAVLSIDYPREGKLN